MALCSLCNEAVHRIDQCWVKIKIDRLCPTDEMKNEALEAWRRIIKREIESNRSPADSVKARQFLFYHFRLKSKLYLKI